jgi:deoxyribose-phosphate aldolase
MPDVQNGMKESVKRVAIGADHGAYATKELVKTYLTRAGYTMVDVGTDNGKTAVDYPDFAYAVARSVVSDECDRGIMLDGAGIGSSMVCNKVHGIRAALCWNEKTIINSRQHNNANVLTMGTGMHEPDEICKMAVLWLETAFEGGRHWPRINKMMAIEKNRRRKMDQNELVEKITREVMDRLKEIMKNQSTNLSGTTIPAQGISQTDLAGYIDHTLLKPGAINAQFDQLVSEALQYKFYSVCVNSSWVPYVAKKLRGSEVKICSVVGFPLGEMDSRSKAFETRNAIANGAHEIDMVMNVGALKSRNLKLVEEDIRAVKRACRSNTILKVIIETSLLTDEEKVLACEIAKKADASFVKTSTGFGGGGATVQDIALMRRVVGQDMGVKASGGIKDFKSAVELIKAGATRIGAGASVQIVTGGTAAGSY